MKRAIEITKERREKQIEYNKKHNIKPITIIKKIEKQKSEIKGLKHLPQAEIQNQITTLDAEMRKAAENLDFETAIKLRDKLESLKKIF